MNKLPLLVIGERVLDRTMSKARIAGWEKTFWKHGWSAARLTPGLGGKSGQRLQELLGEYQMHKTNLLPPDRESGTWDTELAWHVASGILLDIAEEEDNPSYSGVVMLGRRVAETIFMYGDIPDFCETSDAVDLDFLSLPHPSPLNRWWGVEGNMKKAQDAIAAFVEKVQPQQKVKL